MGSVLMPWIHARLFGIDFKKARPVIFLLISSWYLITLLSRISEVLELKDSINYGLIAIAFWQGIYLNRLRLG